MKVLRLEINGFKSFADRTLVEFPQAMCAVVGPNGCGKSNVVDAVRWVLGEQSARQLRGHAMEDVLFNGAQARGGTGLAEVSLVLENEGDVTAPQFADLPEIMVTRRLYRSGDSEYLINKVPCRLKDIQQLFMDTGLGNRAYAIIEQGRVASFIEARPEERRLWVEEAAGITRYKNQKKVSLRKMEAARDNLSRLDDIIHEVGTQMERLKRQAKKAQRHQELRERIRELDLNITSSEYDQLCQGLSDVSAEQEAVGAQLLLAQQRLTGLETDVEALRVRLSGAEQEIATAAQRRLETQGSIQKAENEITLLGREAESQRRLAQRWGTERAELEARLGQLQRELNTAQRRLDEQEAAMEGARAAVARAAQQAAATSESLSGREEDLDQAKSALVEAMSQASQARNRLGDLERALSDLSRRRESLALRQDELESELAGLDDAAAEAGQGVDEVKAELGVVEDSLLDAREAHDEARRQAASLAKAEQEAGREASRLAAAVEAQELSLGSYDWAQGTVREVMNAASKGELPCPVEGLVAEKLAVEPGWEAVAEAALGLDLQALLVRDGAAAQALAQWVAEKKLGRVRILALDDLAAQAAAAPAGSDPVARAVRPAPGCEALAGLVAGAGRCPDLAAAWSAALNMAPGQVAVTPTGQRLDRPGAAFVGQSQGGSILAQRNLLAERKEELDQARSRHESLAADLEAIQDQIALGEEELATLSGRQRDLARRLADYEQEAFRASEAAASKRRQLEGLEFDAEECLGQLNRVREEQTDLAARLEGLEEQRALLEEDLARAQSALAGGRQELEEAREAESQARLEMASLETSGRHAAGEARRLESEVAAARSRMEALSADAEAAEEAAQVAQSRRDAQQNQLGGLYAQLDDQEAEHRRAKELLSQAQMRAGDLEAQRKQARAELKQVEEEASRLDLRRQQIELKREHVCSQALERCRVDLTDGHQAYLPEKAIDLEAGRQQLTKLRERLNRLGPVNLEAISEHEALAERHGFLSEQRGDLEASLEDLRSAIRKINQQSRTRFTATLATVNERLGEVFPVLFGGGKAELVLVNDADPLEAGLHLLVELPGKKVRNLEALSGGEKAMAAAAVLFALFLIRPAPFCILDEVDAPLDEANVGRFHDLLRRLSARSQILMVTHSRRTMEIMDLLYGVTMEEKGVSKLLAINLKQGHALAA